MKTMEETENAWSVAKIIFPYPSMKPTQWKFIHTILTTNNPLFISTKTGVGKTSALLTALMALKKTEDKIVVFVRTKSQINVFMRELGLLYQQIIKNWDKLQGYFPNFPFILPVLGKNELCIRKKNGLPSEMYTHICELTKCPLKNRTKDITNAELVKMVKDLYNTYPQMITTDDLVNVLNTGKYCPYFLSQILIPKSEIIVTSYPFLENFIMFKTLFNRLNTNLSNIFIAIDEAHNLYRIMNQDLSINTIKRAQSEYPSSMFKMLLTLLEKEQTIKMDEYYEEMKELGQTLFPILQEQIAKDELKSINAYLAYYFLQQAQNQTLTSDTKKISLINPLPSIILNKVNTAKKIVLMSGSFEPLSSYQLLYGLVNSKQLKILANKKETNGRYFIVSNPTYNGKFENRTVTYYELIWKAIDSLFSNIPGHTIVFSPSYSYLNQLVEMNPTKFAVVENPELNINEATTMLVNSTKKLLLGCVAGGKISEGIEFTQNGQSLIKGVMITALPYPPPSIETDIVYDELSERYGEHLARNFTITIPTVQRLAQSFGRAIRSERDKAVHILLDSRGTRFSNEFDFERFNSLERLNKVVKAFFTTNNG